MVYLYVERFAFLQPVGRVGSSRMLSHFSGEMKAHREVTRTGFVWALEVGQRRNRTCLGQAP